MLFDQFLAIDYGTKFIKGVLFKNVLGTVSIIRSETLEIVKLEDEDMDDYEYNIIRFIQSFFPEEFKFVTNINLDRLYIRDLVVPLTSEKAVREIIPFEVENKLPFPTETMEVLGVLSKIDEDNSYVVTFNSEQKELERVMSPFVRGEARLSCLSVDSYVLSSLVDGKSKVSEDYQFIAQLDIGSEISLFNTLQLGKLYHTRSFQYGSSDLTNFIINEMKCNYAEADEIKCNLSAYLLEEYDIIPSEMEFLLKKYKISSKNFEAFRKYAKEYTNRIITEIEKSIFSLLDTERPQAIYISGGGSKLEGMAEIIGKKLEIPVLKYELPTELKNDVSFVQAYATGMHYMGKSSERIDFLVSDFAKKLNKNVFRLSNFLPHLVLGGISLFILLFVFLFGVIIDKRKIAQNKEILVEKYKKGFGEEPLDSDSVMSSAISKLKKEQKKTEIFRLFLNKESILDVLSEVTEKFPDKENFPFILDKFIFNGDEVQIYGRVNDFADIGTVEAELEKSSKFKNIKVLNKRLITGVSKYKVSFKLRLDVASPETE